MAFPVFVADLIKGTFNAIIQANIQQMEQFQRLLENVTKTVDQFMNENITDDQARDWLQQRFPDHIKVNDGTAVPKDGAEEKPAPDFRGALNMPDNVTGWRPMYLISAIVISASVFAAGVFYFRRTERRFADVA